MQSRVLSEVNPDTLISVINIFCNITPVPQVKQSIFKRKAFKARYPKALASKLLKKHKEVLKLQAFSKAQLADI